jgi:ZIP family zinc transporter
MGEAILFGLIASSALIIGGAIGAYFDVPKTINGVLLAFASGSLIAALCFELFPDAFERGGATRAGPRAAGRRHRFVIANTCWTGASPATRASASPRRSRRRRRRPGTGGPGAGARRLRAAGRRHPRRRAREPRARACRWPATRGSLTLLWRSSSRTCPSRCVGAQAMTRDGRSATFAIGLWSICALILGGAVVWARRAVGRERQHAGDLPGLRGRRGLASLADTLMPEAFEHGRPWNSLATGLGFFVSFMLAEA